ncbi:MAG: hypothetical protein JOY69_10030 [Candidatus Eremiobacteraeota bacterium]|nr:hypothetical protein [Candidatus Eremiobacteraeota bacterium]
MLHPRAFLPLLAGVAFAIAGCSSATTPTSQLPEPARPLHRSSHRHSTTIPIAHIVLMIQENRSFDNLFATFPGANGATQGTLHNGKVVPLKEGDLVSRDISHMYATYLTDYDGGKMDGFDLSKLGGQPAGQYPYRYVNPTDIQPYWTLAQQYVLADAMFQTQGSGSFTAHQDLIAGGTAIDANDSLIDDPSAPNWSCNAPPSTTTSLITTSGQYLLNQGPFPCLTYPSGTMRDLLDAAGVSWKYYAPTYKNRSVGVLWNAFAAIDAVRNGPEWHANISLPQTNVLRDISSGTLPKLAWVIPNSQASDHPWTLRGHDDGPAWVATVVNAIGSSNYWNSTAIIIVWDDWGGFYDHVPPPFFDNAGGLGFRVPMLVVSPYALAGTVAHTQYEFGSILKFIEETFGLGSLGTTDARATSIGNVFNYLQTPIPFTPIPAARSRAYFLHQPADDHPVDTE